ncbi:hypothetical protein JFT64_27845 [Pseudomonas carnis]|uniref:hypothetical protein n=1 Tax=Pseudomonas carnis TaxID=2487355 RepID=UPI0018E858F6|nr:hypothetical protein [Pseudomonas carnis]MBJ2215850.1 hypothetical protein [Pseudomonas carnis]
MDLIIGKKASELEAIFEQQSQAIKASPGLKFERSISYASVVCDKELERIPLDALSLGLAVAASEDDEGMLDERFVFSLLLAASTLHRTTIDVPADSVVDPQLVLEEAESHGLSVRVLLPDSPVSVDSVRGYVELLLRYTSLWLSQSSGNFSLSPLDGYLEYKFQIALGHQPEQTTTDPEMQAFFTDGLAPEAMDFIKEQLDAVIERDLGGPEYFQEQIAKMGAAMHLKQVELQEARRQMLEQELDQRTPVPNLIRVTSKLTGLSTVDAAGMIYELKNGIHAVLDKYLPPQEGEEQFKAGRHQVTFAENIVSLLGSALGGHDHLLAAWDELSTSTQLKQTVDLDRGVTAPSEAAVRAAEHLTVSAKVTALAAGEFAALIGSILKTGKAIDEIGIERPKPVVEVTPSNIIAVG